MSDVRGLGSVGVSSVPGWAPPSGAAQTAVPTNVAAPVTPALPQDGFASSSEVGTAEVAEHVALPQSELFAVAGERSSPPPSAAYGYTVKTGDTLSGLAARFQVSLHQLLTANPQVSNPDKIYAGDTLAIPSWQGYVVQKGDTVSGLAAARHTTVARIVQANQLKNPDLIIAGSILALPTDVADQSNAPAPVRAWGNALHLGGFQGSESGAGHHDYVFDRGTVDVSNVTGELNGVRIGNDVLPKPVAQVAVLLAERLGTYQGSGPGGSPNTTEYRFAQGKLVSDGTSLVGGEHSASFDSALTRIGQDLGLGTLTLVEHGAGHAYFHFSKGTLDTSNETGALNGMSLESGDSVPGNVLTQASLWQYGAYQGQVTAGDVTTYTFAQGSVTVRGGVIQSGRGGLDFV